MKNQFNPRTKKISSIGEELRFQREYYCYKNNISLPLKIDSTDKNRDERKCLQDVLYDFIYRNCGNNSELATSYDVLYAIENGKSKKKSEKYNPNSYFLRMFCLFKIYGFLDSMTILELLKNKYKLEPSFESSKKIINDLENYYTVEHLILTGQKGKVVKVNIKYGRILYSKDIALKLATSKEEKDSIEKLFSNVKTEINQSGYTDERRKERERKLAEQMSLYLNRTVGYDFSKERAELQNKMKKLSNFEKYCISLELGRDTSYIDDFINNNLQNINIDTLIKTLEYFKMDKEKFYTVLNTVKKDFGSESIFYSKFEVL